jgi:predicted transcriptional regulator
MKQKAFVDVIIQATYPIFMPRKATAVRLEPALQRGLETLSKVLKRPMNQLINEALHDYVGRRSHEVEQDVTQTLAALRAYRRRDPGFDAAISASAKAEAEHGKSDDLDGEIVIGEIVDGQPAQERGPVAAEIRRLLPG